jgi:hypothetical protein
MAQSGEPGLVQDLTGELADRLGRVADTVNRGGMQAVANDLRRFARRQPGVFLVGAFAVGFMGARLLRAGVGSGSNGDRATASNGSRAAEGSPAVNGLPGAVGGSITPPAGSIPTPGSSPELRTAPAVEIPVGAEAPEGLIP